MSLSILLHPSAMHSGIYTWGDSHIPLDIYEKSYIDNINHGNPGGDDYKICERLPDHWNKTKCLFQILLKKIIK